MDGLERSPSTVSREIRRNGGCSAYRAGVKREPARKDEDDSAKDHMTVTDAVKHMGLGID
jgi:IS30 family transposase